MSIRNAGSLLIKVPQRCLYFGSTGKYAQKTDTDDSLDMGTSDFSIAFWIKTSTTSQSGVVSKMVTATYIGYTVALSSVNGCPYLMISSRGNPNYTSIIGTIRVNDNKWHHVAVTADRDGNCNIYIDGAYNNAGSIALDSGDIDNTAIFYIGKNPWYPFDGFLHSIYIYKSKILSAIEVKKLYNGIEITDGLIAKWKVDDKSGGIIEDSIGDNDLTIVGATWADRDIRCWCSRWSEDNYNVTIETFLEAPDRNFLFSNIRPGSVKEIYNILGTPKFIDISYNSSNSLILQPLGGFGLSGVAQTRTIACKNISDDFINERTYSCKLETIRLDV